MGKYVVKAEPPFVVIENLEPVREHALNGHSHRESLLASRLISGAILQTDDGEWWVGWTMGDNLRFGRFFDDEGEARSFDDDMRRCITEAALWRRG